jgi:hypothetical protein
MARYPYLRGRAYQYAYLYVAQRDGEHCCICGREPPKFKLQIEHINRNTSDNDPVNFKLLCQPCNLAVRKMTPAAKAKLFVKHTSSWGRGGEGGRGKAQTAASVNRKLFDTGNGSIEMRLNSVIEPQYREWLVNFLKEAGIIRKFDAEVAGADIVGCSQKTTKRYLEKMLNPITGVVVEDTDAFGVRIIKLRPDFMSTGKPSKPLQQPPKRQRKPVKPLKSTNGRTKPTKRLNQNEKGENQNDNVNDSRQ